MKSASILLAVVVLLQLALLVVVLIRRRRQKAHQEDLVSAVSGHPLTLQPVDQTLDLPTLRFTRAREYWARYAVGAQVEIPLLRGPLGLWQLDHHRFDPPIKTFYRKTNSQ